MFNRVPIGGQLSVGDVVKVLEKRFPYVEVSSVLGADSNYDSNRKVSRCWGWCMLLIRVNQKLIMTTSLLKPDLYLLHPGRACVLWADRSGSAARRHVQRHSLPTGAAGPGRDGNCHHAKDPGNDLLLPESRLPGELQHTHTETLVDMCHSGVLKGDSFSVIYNAAESKNTDVQLKLQWCLICCLHMKWRLSIWIREKFLF